MLLSAGTEVMRRLAAFFDIVIDGGEEEAAPTVSAGQVDASLDVLAAAGVPLVEDRELARTRFLERRAAYDRALVGLARLVDAPASASWP